MQTLVTLIKSRLIVAGVQAASAAVTAVRRFDAVSSLLHLPQAQPLLESVGRLRGQTILQRAAQACPAYGQFLQEAGGTSVAVPPVTTKDNYIRRYGIAARCYGGRLPLEGTVIDESSGSSGIPNQWVRSRAERLETARSLRSAFRRFYPGAGRVILNCFALGPWATGMTVSLALAESGILKSLGADLGKLENTLRTFGPTHRYLICGYPPFIKNFLATTTLDLTPYHLDLVVGGEGMSERLREQFLTCFRTVVSSYGASDLEINVGLETPRTLHLRRACAKDAVLCRALFGRDTPPMLFQYNPVDYVVEALKTGELAFTLTRSSSAAPKIRYNLRDLGGVMPWREMEARLHRLGHAALTHGAERQSAFPLLWVWGRNDCSVPFCGAKVFPGDIEAVLSSSDALATVNSFQLSADPDDAEVRRLRVALELSEGVSESTLRTSLTDLQRLLFEGLRRVNQDFREVTRSLNAGCVDIALHPFAAGPFAGRDNRVKNQYVAL